MKNFFLDQHSNPIIRFRDSKAKNKTQFTNFQVDYIRLRTSTVSKNDINWNNLVPHPKLKDNFTLNAELSNNYKNFSLYYGKEDSIFIKMSIPYFLNGHNYTEIGNVELVKVEDCLKKWLNIDIHNAEILEIEYGMFEDIEISGLDYISNILDTQIFSLEKSTPYFKMFGKYKTKVHYKIYDAIANAKSKKVFTKAQFPNKNIIKHELKFEDVKKVFPDLVYSHLYEQNFLQSEFKNLLFTTHSDLKFKENYHHQLEKFDSVNILFTALKNLEDRNFNVLEMLNDMIDNSEMTASQKSKRKKYFTDLDRQSQFETAF